MTKRKNPITYMRAFRYYFEEAVMAGGLRRDERALAERIFRAGWNAAMSQRGRR